MSRTCGRLWLVAALLGAARWCFVDFSSQRRARGRTGRTACASSRAKQPHVANVEGDFYVDHSCIDCDTCRWMAPDTFGRTGAQGPGQSYVYQQPQAGLEQDLALQAMISCPTGSIRTRTPLRKTRQILDTFPLRVADRLPNVFHLGFHSKHSFGAASYFVASATEQPLNIMFDSPRYSSKLANLLEAAGGVDLMVMSHKDDVADHNRWKERFPQMRRVMHSLDVRGPDAWPYIDMTTVEEQLEGDGPWTLAAQKDVAAWMAESTWRASPRDASFESWAQRAGAQLIAYGTPASHVPSVVYCRWLEDNCMPKQYPPDLLHFLVSQGVARVIVGHTPHGNCPTVIPHEGLSVIMGDTSYSNMKSDLAYPGDNRGDAVCEIAIFDDRCVVRGRTGATAEGKPRQVVHYVVTESSSAGDPHIGVMQPPSASVPLDACFFVKACLPAMEGKDARYLLCKVDGFTNTYQEESPAEVLRVFGSQSVLKANATTRKRLTSHGEEFGASCSAEGDVLEHIFRRLDRDHDGVVTAHELLTACSDPEVRRALQWTFPDTCLEDVFRELDANEDGIVTLHEFQSRVKRS